jgi:uncharacterized protein (TIGR02757 family)
MSGATCNSPLALLASKYSPSPLRELLDYWYEKIDVPEFIENDPVKFPRRYFEAGARREDVEIAAFLTAVIAWGRRPMILASAEKMFALMGKSPYDYVMSLACKKLGERNVHRTFFEGDLKYLCTGFRALYKKYQSIEKLFLTTDPLEAKPNRLAARFTDSTDKENEYCSSPVPVREVSVVSGLNSSVWQGIGILREEMAKANGGAYSKHVSDPASSACKRFHLALRWLVRRGGCVDLGLWKNISPSALYIPLDVHVGRVARSLGLLGARKANDNKAVIALTARLRELCPEDPVKYDYALFGLGVNRFTVV